MERETMMKHWVVFHPASALLSTCPVIQKVLRLWSSFWLSAWSFPRDGLTPEPCNSATLGDVTVTEADPS